MEIETDMYDEQIHNIDLEIRELKRQKAEVRSLYNWFAKIVLTSDMDDISLGYLSLFDEKILSKITKYAIGRNPSSLMLVCKRFYLLCTDDKIFVTYWRKYVNKYGGRLGFKKIVGGYNGTFVKIIKPKSGLSFYSWGRVFTVGRDINNTTYFVKGCKITPNITYIQIKLGCDFLFTYCFVDNHVEHCIAKFDEVNIQSTVLKRSINTNQRFIIRRNVSLKSTIYIGDNSILVDVINTNINTDKCLIMHKKNSFTYIAGEYKNIFGLWILTPKDNSLQLFYKFMKWFVRGRLYSLEEVNRWLISIASGISVGKFKDNGYKLSKYFQDNYNVKPYLGNLPVP